LPLPPPFLFPFPFSSTYCLDIFMSIFIHSFIRMHSSSGFLFCVRLFGVCDILLNANYQRLLTVFYYLSHRLTDWLSWLIFFLFLSICHAHNCTFGTLPLQHFFSPPNLRQLQTLFDGRGEILRGRFGVMDTLRGPAVTCIEIDLFVLLSLSLSLSLSLIFFLFYIIFFYLFNLLRKKFLFWKFWMLSKQLLNWLYVCIFLQKLY